ncbi:trypsin 3A1-like [Colias croceus]|uniref:trypsin 3A1-like n=1 Tax=Colias crocea TaxID=72248 RepID=UPI001E27C411|nr:trypsin 3A1-like [Colias croceus]
MKCTFTSIQKIGVNTKMSVFILCLVFSLFIFSQAKIDTESDDMEIERISRKNMYRTEWQYEGLPIEFPSRRSNANKTRDKITDTTKQTHTLDRRYRRIYNADEVATVEDYPFLAALLVNRQLWCGAVIIDTDKVLTAAHCLQLQYNNRFFREYVKMLSIRVGSSNATAGGDVYHVSEIFFHPNYKPNTLEFNFAVIKLDRNISYEKLDTKVAKIDYEADKLVPTDAVITFLGWGSVLGVGGLGGQVLLQKLELPVYDIADCQEIYGRDLVHSRTNFCAGYITKAKNVCNHDAGGPAIQDGVLVGILSFSAKRCDLPYQPAVFSAVGSVASWLDTIGEHTVKLMNTELKYPDWTNKQE